MSTLRLKPDAVEWRFVEGEIVALDLRSSMYLSVTGSGTVLWKALADGATADQLTATLLDEFDVSPVRAKLDVEHFLTDLRKRGLIEVAT